MSTKKHFGYGLCVWFVVVALLLSGCGSKHPKVYRVGLFSGISYISGVADGFKAKMTELGYVEGEDIIYDFQETELDMDEYRRILQKFVDDKVDLIVTFPTEAAMVAKEVAEGSGIPVLFIFSFTENTGLIEDVRAPGGNITGVRYPAPDIALRRFEIMRQLAPDATRFWIPYLRGTPIIQAQMEILAPAAEAAGITLIEAPADDAAELDAALQALVVDGAPTIDAIMFLAEPLAVVPDAFRVMAKFAFDYQVPIGGALMEVDGYGSIYGVNVDIYKIGVQAAPLADKILKGADPGATPVLSAENFLQINYTTAQKFGIEVPEGLLNQADEVIR
ncbi:MAG: ABC transporter substrate-binding protein [Anaerolineae bacterium]|nr:ABC transporter substrate-binding protein [Anaerolineae bacterium]